jgi:hypothetical protein
LQGSRGFAGAAMVVGTRVATSFGWRPVEALTEGDMVLTFDHGMQPLTGVRRGTMSCRFAAPQDWPLLVPAGALGNQEEALLTPEQAVMIESDLAEELAGDPFVLVPAAAFDGACGIERVLPEGAIDTVTLTFAKGEVVFTRAGILCHCAGQAAGYAILSDGLAADLVGSMTRLAA